MPTFPHPSSAGGPSPASASPGTTDPLLAEALALQELLRDALHRATQLVVALKQDKRTRRALTSALGSLRKLAPWPRPSVARTQLLSMGEENGQVMLDSRVRR